MVVLSPAFIFGTIASYKCTERVIEHLRSDWFNTTNEITTEEFCKTKNETHAG